MAAGAAAAALALTLWPCSAAPGVAAQAITLGQTASFSGPNKHLGLHYRAGLLAAFTECNAAGGVHGRRLRLVSRDDSYEPALAEANVKRFVAENNVFAMIGGVGTPTAKRIAPILRRARVPFVGLFTGAGFLRNAARYPNIVNLRATYQAEVDLMVDHMVRELGKRRFGVVYQDDAFGRSVLANFKQAVEAHGLTILARSAFSRNTHASHSSLFILAKADLDALLIVGTAVAAAEVINLANSLGHEYVTANVSFAAAFLLRERVAAGTERVLMTEVVPDPSDQSLAVVRRFHAAMRLARAAGDSEDPHPVDSVALEGYILGRFVIAVLDRMPQPPTREAFLENALGPAVMVDDWPIAFAPGSNAGSAYVRLNNLAGTLGRTPDKLSGETP